MEKIKNKEAATVNLSVVKWARMTFPESGGPLIEVWYMGDGAEPSLKLEIASGGEVFMGKIPFER